MTTLGTRERAGDRAARRAAGQGTPEGNAGPESAGGDVARDPMAVV
jgi:hypothetical protein